MTPSQSPALDLFGDPMFDGVPPKWSPPAPDIDEEESLMINCCPSVAASNFWPIHRNDNLVSNLHTRARFTVLLTFGQTIDGFCTRLQSLVDLKLVWDGLILIPTVTMELIYYTKSYHTICRQEYQWIEGHSMIWHYCTGWC